MAACLLLYGYMALSTLLHGHMGTCVVNITGYIATWLLLHRCMVALSLYGHVVAATRLYGHVVVIRWLCGYVATRSWLYAYMAIC